MKQSVIIICACVLAMGTKAADMPEFPFVFAYGRSERQIEPNMAVISMEIEVYHKNPTNGLSELDNKTAKVAAFLLDKGVDKSDIVSFDIRKSVARKRKDYEELEIIGYTFSRDIRATIRNLNAYKQIATELQSMSNTKDIRTKFDRDDRDAISGELILEATEDSKTRARTLARAYNAELGTIFAVSEKGFYSMGIEFGMGDIYDMRKRLEREPNYSMAGSASVAKPDILFLPKTITFKQDITTIFRLKVTD